MAYFFLPLCCENFIKTYIFNFNVEFLRTLIYIKFYKNITNIYFKKVYLSIKFPKIFYTREYLP